MWADTPEGRDYVLTISKSIVTEIAPEELDLFDELVDEYYRDPTPPSTKVNDDPLGFGIGETLIAVTPAVTAAVSSVLAYLSTEAVKATQEEGASMIRAKIKALFSRGSDDNPSKKKEAEQVSPPSAQETNINVNEATENKKDEEDTSRLTPEQLEQVKKLARRQAVKFGLSSDLADKMAYALIGSLALTS